MTFILPNRWQNGAESLGIETTNCLWLEPRYQWSMSCFYTHQLSTFALIFALAFLSSSETLLPTYASFDGESNNSDFFLSLSPRMQLQRKLITLTLVDTCVF